MSGANVTAGHAHGADAAWARQRSLAAAAVAVLLVVGLFVLWPVLETPYTGDDFGDSQTSAELAWNEESTIEHARSMARVLQDEEGRFLPVAEVENVVIFDTVHDRDLYKVMQVVAVLAVVLLVGCFVGMFTHSSWAGLATSALLVPGLQLRLWSDPIHSAGLLMPSLAAKLLAAWMFALMALRSQRWLVSVPLLVAAAGFHVAAVTQYEVAYLVIPAAGVLVWHEQHADRNRRLAALGALLGPGLLLGDYVVTLRSLADPLPVNLSNLALDAVLPTFTYQFLGSFPLSASVFRGTGVPGVWESVRQSGVGGILAGIAVAVVVVHAIREWRPSSGRTLVSLAVVGLLLIVGAAIPTSLSLRWQRELDWGLVNLPVFLQTLGMAVLLGSLLVGLRCGLHRFVRLGLFPDPPQHLRVATYATLGLLVALAVITASAGNRWVADELQGVRTRQDLALASIDAGLFKRVDDSAGVVLRSEDGLGYFNERYVAWRGGPSSLVFYDELPEIHTPCGAHDLCDEVGHRLFLLEEFAGVHGQVLLLAPLVAHGNPAVVPTVLLDEAVLLARPVENLDCRVTSGESQASDDESGTSDWVLRECEGPPTGLDGIAAALGSGETMTSDFLAATTLNAAIDAGALWAIDDGDLVVTNLEVLNDDLAGVYVAWSGGPSNLDFVTEVPAGSAPCGDAWVCDPSGRFIYHLREIPVGDGDVVLMLAPVASAVGNPVDPLIVMGHTTLFGPASKVRTCDMHGPEPGHIPESDEIWATRQCSGPPSAASTFSRWVGSGCTEEIKGWFICTD